MKKTLNEQLLRMYELMGINENIIFEKLSNDDIYNKYYSKIPKEEFDKIVDTDPTKKQDGSVGKYTKWMLNLYLSKNLKIEDLYKAKEYLTLYAKHFNHVEIKDINKIKSLPDLYGQIEKFIHQPNDYKSNSEISSEIKKDTEKVYEDSDWLILVPHTKEASCYYGKGTQWCTAASDNDYENNMFDTYNDDGRLYINIDKKNNRKYQFHFETDSFMDEQDNNIAEPVALTTKMPSGAINYYKEKFGEIRGFNSAHLYNGDTINVNGELTLYGNGKTYNYKNLSYSRKQRNLENTQDVKNFLLYKFDTENGRGSMITFSTSEGSYTIEWAEEIIEMQGFYMTSSFQQYILFKTQSGNHFYDIDENKLIFTSQNDLLVISDFMTTPEVYFVEINDAFAQNAFTLTADGKIKQNNLIKLMQDAGIENMNFNPDTNIGAGIDGETKEPSIHIYSQDGQQTEYVYNFRKDTLTKDGRYNW